MKHLLISIFFTILFSSIPKVNSTPWNILQEGDINISYYWDKFPWCKATIEIESSIDEILEHIENINNYENIFDTVSSSKEYDNNVVHIVLDIPSLFADRDYVVKFVKYKEDNHIVYEFNSIDELSTVKSFKLGDKFLKRISGFRLTVPTAEQGESNKT